MPGISNKPWGSISESALSTIDPTIRVLKVRTASAELTGGRGMRIPDRGDREEIHKIAGLLREVLAKVAR